ncbi:MAG: MATE family efflux transporter [Bacillota bacterium]|nr:MATE family efflux transporter [Bacillota bacterium]
MRKKNSKELQKLQGELLFTNKYLIKLMWPLFVEQLLLFAVGLLDSIMVASVGEAAVSAVSLVDSLMILIINIMTALATGGAVIVGQYLGQKKEVEARAAADQLILFALLLSIAIIAIMYTFRKLIISLIFGNIDEDVAHYCYVYYSIVMASVPFISVYNAGAALFRSTGNSKASMKVSVLMNFINVAGNAVLIYGFHRGVEGVAIPTLVSRIAAAVIIYIMLRKPEHIVHISMRFVFRPRWHYIRKILKIGVPNSVENSMFQLGKLILLSMISGFGTASIAANAVGNAVSMVAVLPGMAMGYGIVSVISQCVGAGDYQQVEFYTRKLMKWVYTMMFVSNVIILVCIPFIVNIYGLSEETGRIASHLIMINGLCAILIWPLSFSLPNALRASGDVTYTMIVGVGSMWVFRIVMGIILGRTLGLGVMGVWIAMIVDWAVRSICFCIRYKNGKWKHSSIA